jgi:hypothetical protein
VRGAVSGLGFLNIVAGTLEVFAAFRADERTHVHDGPHEAA